MTPSMNFYKSKIQSAGNLDKLKSRIFVRGYLQNKDLVRYTWPPTAYMRNLKHFLSYASKNKARVHQLDFIRAFLQENLRIKYL